jgi:hypothetical protein
MARSKTTAHAQSHNSRRQTNNGEKGWREKSCNFVRGNKQKVETHYKIILFALPSDWPVLALLVWGWSFCG